MLEPLYRCNLACAGCGKIQYPGHILKRELTPEECFRAVDECGVPTVAIPGGEPLMHPRIDEIVRGLVARKKYVYMCTNALLLQGEAAPLHAQQVPDVFGPHGWREGAPRSFGVQGRRLRDRAGGHSRGGQARLPRHHQYHAYSTASTASRCAQFFTEMMDAGVEGMMLSPGYSYDKAPDQQHFTGRERNQSMFRKMLSNRDPRWQFNMSPLFLEFLMGKRNLQCTPWGMPAYSIFGWQKPCYLLQDGYADTFQELLDSTDWSKYGYESGQSEVRQLHAALGLRSVARWITRSRSRASSPRFAPCCSRSYRDAEALRADRSREAGSSPLVQIEAIAPTAHADRARTSRTRTSWPTASSRRSIIAAT